MHTPALIARIVRVVIVRQLHPRFGAGGPEEFLNSSSGAAAAKRTQVDRHHPEHTTALVSTGVTPSGSMLATTRGL
jgi:hypothetical protein